MQECLKNELSAVLLYAHLPIHLMLVTAAKSMVRATSTLTAMSGKLAKSARKPDRWAETMLASTQVRGQGWAFVVNLEQLSYDEGDKELQR